MSGSVPRSLAAVARLAWESAPRRLAVHVALAVAMGLLPVGVAWATKVLLDRLVTPGRPVTVPVALLAAASAAAVVLPALIRYVDRELQRAISLATRRRLHAAVGRFGGLRYFEDPRFHDRLALAAESGPAGPPEVVSSVLGLAQGLLTVGGFLSALAAINPWMLAVVGGAALPALTAELRLGKYRAELQWELGRTARREFFYSQLITSVTAAKEIRLYGLDRLFGARMLTELRRIHAGNRAMDRRELVVQGLQGLLGATVAGIGLWWAVSAAADGRLTVGDVSVFVAAVAAVQNGLIGMVVNIGRAHEALLLFEYYAFIVGAPPDLAVTAAAPAPASARPSVAPLRRGIEFDDVWFRYDERLPWVLRGVSFTIPAGGTTALVGHNGAGKSTIVKLLCRFYDPDRGAVRWDGVDLRDLPPEELRRRVGAVFQDFMAYELSAADNIGIGDVSSLDDRGRIAEAAGRVDVHDTLAALPDGYDTLLTRAYADPADRDDPGTGVVLSGGQWQRVAIARALMRDGSELLILDEPSQGLDAEAEHRLSRSLRRHRAGRTTLLISHRLNTVREADVIIVLSDGDLVERGTHAELLAANGLYARLYLLQAAGYGADPDSQVSHEAL